MGWRVPELLEEILPPNAHELVDGLLYIYYYELPWLVKRCVCSFPSRQSLIDAMVRSSTTKDSMTLEGILYKLRPDKDRQRIL